MIMPTIKQVLWVALGLDVGFVSLRVATSKETGDGGMQVGVMGPPRFENYPKRQIWIPRDLLSSNLFLIWGLVGWGRSVQKNSHFSFVQYCMYGS